MKKILLYIILAALPVFLALPVQSSAEAEIEHYTCGMHPSVKVSPEAYANGETQCPICHMNLTPVMKQEAAENTAGAEAVVSRVKISDTELQRAGVRTEPVMKRHLFKEIKAVGTVAYDPKLAVAQDEYLSAVRTLEKIREGNVAEITERAEGLVSSAEKKLLLLGLGPQQIEELKTAKEVQTNLILPEKSMWIYGDLYEYQTPWIKEGALVKVTTASLPGKEFSGTVSSINPVLDPKTRTVRFRAMVENPGLMLKPQMYVDIRIMSHYADPDDEHEVPAIPQSALLDTGARRIVWVEKSVGNFEGRMVKVGPLSSVSGETRQYFPVISGLVEGENVVTSGNFLIDSQSQITGSAASSYGGSLGDEGHSH